MTTILYGIPFFKNNFFEFVFKNTGQVLVQVWFSLSFAEAFNKNNFFKKENKLQEMPRPKMFVCWQFRLKAFFFFLFSFFFVFVFSFSLHWMPSSRKVKSLLFLSQQHLLIYLNRNYLSNKEKEKHLRRYFNC
jgi:hypothetical protein